MKKRIKLRVKIFLYFGIGALILIGIFFSLSQYIADKTFEEYKINSTRDKDLGYISLIEELLADNTPVDDIRTWLILDSRQDQVVFRLLNSNGDLIWEIIKNSGAIQGAMGQGKQGQSPNSQIGKNVDYISYDINFNKEKYGTLEVGRMGQFILSEADVDFKNNLTDGLIFVALFGIIITAILSFILSRQISKPILNITDAALRIKEGEYSVKADENTDTFEIGQLAETVNDLGSNLEKQETLRIRLTSDVSHELRTPLNVLQNEVEALIDGIWEPSKYRFEQCHEEIIRLTDLVNDLEKLTDISSYDLKLSIEELHVNKLITDVAEQFKGKFNSKKLMTKMNLSKDEITINADKNKLRQVLFNLLSNAVKFTPENGMITLTTKVNANICEIIIEDNGIGIEKKDIEHIFERFYRAENSRNRDTGGAGLGLAITMGIVEAHKGTINVVSTPNIGTEFIISLPI